MIGSPEFSLSDPGKINKDQTYSVGQNACHMHGSEGDPSHAAVPRHCRSLRASQVTSCLHRGAVDSLPSQLPNSSLSSSQ